MSEQNPRYELKPFQDKTVSFSGLLQEIRQNPLHPATVSILLRPAKVAGLSLDHLWFRIPTKFMSDTLQYAVQLDDKHSLPLRQVFKMKHNLSVSDLKLDNFISAFNPDEFYLSELITDKNNDSDIKSADNANIKSVDNVSSDIKSDTSISSNIKSDKSITTDNNSDEIYIADFQIDGKAKVVKYLRKPHLNHVQIRRNHKGQKRAYTTTSGYTEDWGIEPKNSSVKLKLI